MRYNGLAFSGLSDAELCLLLTTLGGLLCQRRRLHQGDLTPALVAFAASATPSGSTVTLTVLFSRLMVEALNRCTAYDAERNNLERKKCRKEVARLKAAKWDGEPREVI